jgi:CBS domain-containing protein
VLDLDLSGRGLLELTAQRPSADYLVVAEGRVVGVLSAADLRAALMHPTRSPIPTATPRAGE